MNLTEVAELIKRPKKLIEEQLLPLKSLVEKYPYAQSFAILYLKALSDTQSFHFEDELKKIACSITNRAVLFQLLHEEKVEVEEKAPIAVENISAEALPHENSEPVFDSPKQKEVEQAIENQSEKKELLVEFDLQAMNLAVDNGASFSDARSSEETEEAPEVSATFEIDLSEENHLSKEIFSSAHSYHLDNAEESDQTLANPSPDKKKSFLDWLQASSNTSEVNPPETPTERKEKISSLIEEFIENKPKISKPKADFYSANKKAVESIQEDVIPISPTLAKIYSLQGHYPKSIAIYQQLILKYPEKKTFFANQISEIEKKLNS